MILMTNKGNILSGPSAVDPQDNTPRTPLWYHYQTLPILAHNKQNVRCCMFSSTHIFVLFFFFILTFVLSKDGYKHR